MKPGFIAPRKVKSIAFAPRAKPCSGNGAAAEAAQAHDRYGHYAVGAVKPMSSSGISLSPLRKLRMALLSRGADSNMAKARSRKLKVFQAQIGFYDTVVAAPSQAAALRAWGVHQNLFAEKRAHLTDDPDAVAAAIAHPETPLKRPVGTADPFQLNPVNLPKAPPAPKGSQRRQPKPKPQLPAEPPPDRTALDEAERVLRDLDERRRKEEADFRRRQAELDAEADAAQARYVSARQAATAAVVSARDAYRNAGGR